MIKAAEKTEQQKQDEVITVTLSRADYETLRDMITRQQSLSWLGKWLKNVLLVAIGGIITLIAFGDQIRQLLSLFINGPGN